MKNTKTYQKHLSFETFFSSIKADVLSQKERVLTVLKQQVNQLTDDHRRSVIESAIKDLSAGEKEPAAFGITQNIADEVSKLPDTEIVRYVFHRYRYDVFPKEKRLDKFPPYLQIEPTSICNYRCVFCYQTDQDFTAKANGFMGAMPFELFKEIIDQVEGNVEFFSLASRGEPLLCKDIEPMLNYCEGKFLGLKLNTNASMLTEEKCHAILAGGVNTIVFSADAAQEPLYSQLRVKGSLEKVLGNIKLFGEVRRKHYPRSKIISRVSGVKFGDAQSMDSMIGLWGGLVDQVSFVAYNPWENVYEAQPKNMATPCSDLWRRMFVWYDGKVNPCDTDYKSILSVGTVKDRSISQLWCSGQYEHLRQQHLTENRSKAEPCRRCVVV